MEFQKQCRRAYKIISAAYQAGDRIVANDLAKADQIWLERFHRKFVSDIDTALESISDLVRNHKMDDRIRSVLHDANDELLHAKKSATNSPSPDDMREGISNASRKLRVAAAACAGNLVRLYGEMRGVDQLSGMSESLIQDDLESSEFEALSAIDQAVASR